MCKSADRGSISRTHTFLRILVTYAVILACGAAVFAVRQALSLAVGPGLPPYITFYPLVMLVALLAGVGPGLLVTAIGAFIAVYWKLPVQGHFALVRAADTLGLAIFISMGVFMSIFAELYRRARQWAAVFPQELSLRGSETRFSTAFHSNPIGMSITRLAELNAAPVPPGALVAEVISDLAHEASGRDVKWIVQELPIVQGDRSLLKLAIANLLDNALKYTRPRDTAVIEVRSEKRDDTVVIQVRDNGVGFDPRGAEKLFGVFQRLHSTSEFEGTGIGLANVRRIVSRHGGGTWAESEPGKGSTFSFSLPEKRMAVI